MLNQKSIDFLEEKLQIKSGELKTLIDEKEEKDISSLEIPIVHYYTEEDKTTLESNVKRDAESDAYKKAKAAAIEMALKDLNKKHKVFENFEQYKEHGFDVSDTSFEDFVDAFEGKIKTTYDDEVKSLKAQMDGKGSEEVEKLTKKLSDLKKEKTELQDSIQSVRTEYEQKLTEKDTQIINDKKNDIWEKAVNLIPIDSSHIETEEERLKYLKAQKELLLTAAKQKAKMELEDDKIIIFKGDEKLVNDVKDPIAPEVFLMQFAKDNYFKLEAEDKSGRGGKTSVMNNLTVRSIKSLADYTAYCKKNNIQENSSEADTLHKEIIKYNQDYNKR